LNWVPHNYKSQTLTLDPYSWVYSKELGNSVDKKYKQAYMLCAGYNLATPTNTLHLISCNHWNQMCYNIPISKDRWAYDIIPASVPFLITLLHRHASHQKNILFISGQISAGETEDATSWMFIFISSSVWGLLQYTLPFNP
jgi:hypothetical protein